MNSRRKHGNEDPRGGSGKRGGVTARLQYGRAKDPSAVAEWGIVSPSTVLALIDAVTAQGGAVLFGYSRDRGAYRILIMDDDGKAPVWIPCTTDVDMALEDLVAEVVGGGGEDA